MTQPDGPFDLAPLPVGARAGPARPLRILVAEDDRTTRHLVARLLVLAGHEVTVAEDGVAALAALGDDALAWLDLLVLDVDMPGLSGLEVLRALRARGADVPAVFVTGHARADLLADVNALRSAALVPKPFSSDELLAVVARTIAAACDGAPGDARSP